MASSTLSSIKISDDDGLVKYITERCEGMPASDVWILPPRVAMPSVFTEHMERIYNMEVKPDDIWVITFPKCGTTWTQEMVWLVGNNCNFKMAKEVDLDLRSPFLELNFIGAPQRSPKSSFDYANEMESPRFIKSHLPVGLLPHKLWTVKPKIIYTSRNPIATALSFYHHYKIFNGYSGDLEHFLDAFLKDQIDYGPIWNHFLSFWKMRSQENILFLTFEEMKDDLLSVVKKTTKFLNAKLSEQQITELVEHLNFSNMKNNPTVNKSKVINMIKKDEADKHSFIRKGEKDEWKKALTDEYINRFKEWCMKNKQGTDFPYY